MASLFEGDPQNATSYVESTSEYPKWMQDAIYNQIVQAQSLASKPYTPYELPQVAELSPLQQQAYSGVESMQGQYAPTVAGAITGTQNLAGQNTLSQASPYLTQAGQSTVANIQDYMNPYQQNVMDVIAQQGTRNLTENLLPGVSDAFIKAGQFGSSQMGEFGSRAVRDTQEAIMQQQAQLAQSGYSQAAGLSQADLARQAGLASTVGGLAGQDIQTQLAAQQQAAALAAQQQQMGYADTAALEAAGTSQRSVAQQQLDAAKAQYEAEQAYPWQQLSYAGEQIRGLASTVPQSTATSTASSGQTYSPSVLSQLAGAGSLAKALTTNS